MGGCITSLPVSGPQWGVTNEDATLQKVLGFAQDFPLTIVQQGPTACALCVVYTGGWVLRRGRERAPCHAHTKTNVTKKNEHLSHV
jgi:hypothetical protein